MSFASAAPRTLILHHERQLTRADYADYRTDAIFRLISRHQIIQDDPPDDEAYFDSTFALQELYAVLAERRRV